MAIPAFFKIASEVSKAKNVAEGDVTSAVTKGIKKFNPDKRIDTKDAEPIRDNAQKFDSDKRLKTSNEVDLEDNPPSVFDNPSDIDIHRLMDNPGVLDDLKDVKFDNLPDDIKELIKHPGVLDDIRDVKARTENVMNKEDISEQQQKCIKEFEENRDQYAEDSQAKGNYGEMKVDQDLNNKGLKNLSENRVSDLKTPTGQGIDGVYYDEAKGITYNVEVKYGTKVLDSATLTVKVDTGFFAKLVSFFANFLFNLFSWKKVNVNF